MWWAMTHVVAVTHAVGCNSWWWAMTHAVGHVCDCSCICRCVWWQLLHREHVDHHTGLGLLRGAAWGYCGALDSQLHGAGGGEGHRSRCGAAEGYRSRCGAAEGPGSRLPTYLPTYLPTCPAGCVPTYLTTYLPHMASRLPSRLVLSAIIIGESAVLLRAGTCSRYQLVCTSRYLVEVLMQPVPRYKGMPN